MNKKLLTYALALCFACNDQTIQDKGDLGTDDGSYEGLDAGISDDSGNATDSGGGEDTMVYASIAGSVSVQLYIENDDGEREFVSAEEAYGSDFPFGAIWVGAYTSNESGVETYYGTDTISYPSTTGDNYYIPIEMESSRELMVYAVMDYWQDGIINPDDPIGIWADEILIEQDTNATDINITILVEYLDFGTGGSGGGGGGGAGPGGGADGDDWGDFGQWGGGTGCSDIYISGQVVINEFVPVGADGIIMMTDTAGTSMIDASWFETIATEDGASGNYGFETCDDLGQTNLIGAVDSDANLLIDPNDSWGAYVNADGEDGNPINIDDYDLEEMEVQIPLGDGSGLNIVPFVQLTGTVSVQDGAFDDLPAGSTIYAAALKYRPNNDLTVTSLESIAYDYDEFEWADLTGETIKDWRLAVPSNTIVYLWAYVDEDIDGIVNESGEAVASGGSDDAGSLAVTTINSDHTLELSYSEE
jgi:hypothetical protein